MYNESPLVLEMIRDSIQQDAERRRKAAKAGEAPKPEPAENLFTIHTANRWMQIQSAQPEAKMLFGSFWQQNELCILFADTNLGKSILAVQLGHEISRGNSVQPFANNSKPANVLYMDFELSPKQFQMRYNEGHASHNFAEGLFRAEFNPQAQMPPQFKTFEQYINSAIECAVQRTGASVLIIDNISCLRSGSNEHSNEALALMKHLKSLKSRHNLSILVLAHSPKRNPANPITRNDLQGSKMLMNFADSAFAMGQSNAGPDMRYLKQLKQRGSRETYGTENVAVFQLQKQYGYLRFIFSAYAHEFEHLRRNSHEQRSHLYQQATQLRANGLSQRKIAAQLKIGLSTVNKLLNWR